MKKKLQPYNEHIRKHKKYNEEVHPKLIFFMVRSGLDQRQVAKSLNISEKTLYNWIKQHPKVLQAIKGDHKLAADYKVEDSLFKRATGYEYTEKKVKTRQVYNKFDGVWEEREEEEIAYKHKAPSVGACIFWLQRRMTDHWLKEIDFKQWKDREKKKGEEVPREEVNDLLQVLSTMPKEEIDFLKSAVEDTRDPIPDNLKN